jgi:hypothetical protein
MTKLIQHLETLRQRRNTLNCFAIDAIFASSGGKNIHILASELKVITDHGSALTSDLIEARVSPLSRVIDFFQLVLLYTSVRG